MLNFHMVCHVSLHCKALLANGTEIVLLSSINLVHFFKVCFGDGSVGKLFVAFQAHGGSVI